MLNSLGILSLLSILVINPPESLTTTGQTIPTTDCITKMQAESTWGVRTMPLPEYLRQESLGLASGQGQLVTGVMRGSPADIAGLRTGYLIIEVDQKPLMDSSSLPLLQQPCVVMAWTDAGLTQFQVQPVATDPWVSNLVDRIAGLPELLSNAFGARALESNFTLPGFEQRTVSGPRSLSISSVNGQMLVSAIVDTATGPTQVELRGCHCEVARQLAVLPLEVQAQLVPHLGLLDSHDSRTNVTGMNRTTLPSLKLP